MERIDQALAALFAANGADPVYGSRLPAVLADGGLTRVGAEVHTPVVSGGSEQWSRGTVEQLAERLIGTGLTTEVDIELFLAFSARPGISYLLPLMVSAWGQRQQ